MHVNQQSLESSLAGESVYLLVGSPNVGKSVIFGLLTGRYADVSNYPGTTVELTRGHHKRSGGLVVDLPGANSLLPKSEDELVTRDVLLKHLENPGVRVVQVCDAKNLRRGVFLSLQLAELDLPQVFAANMADEAWSRGYELDRATLARELGVPVLEAVATRKQGLAPLLADEIPYQVVTARVAYPPVIEDALKRIGVLLPPDLPGKRGVCVMLLANEDGLPPAFLNLDEVEQQALREIRAETARRFPEGIHETVNRARITAADEITRQAQHRNDISGPTWLEKLGNVAIHPWLGLPLAGLVLYLIYLFVGVLGAGTMVGLLEDGLFGGVLVPLLDKVLRAVFPVWAHYWLIGLDATAPGAGPGLLLGDYGLISMGLSYAFAIVLPIVGFFFIAFSLLEDSGYLPRLAALLNRYFRVMGLNGKAVLPMMLGLGCDTMATMTARILSTRKERLLVTLLLALGVPCSAQLGVILGLLSALSAKSLLIWLGSLALVMVGVGALANKVLPGNSSLLLLELPPMRVPVVGNLVFKTLARVEWYLREVVPLFLLGTFILWLLHTLDVLTVIEVWAAPLVQDFLGLPAKATEAFLIGFLRRDYGAAGLYAVFREPLSMAVVPVEVEIQVVVSLVTLTLFMPCIANLFMIIKEQGLRTALAISAFIVPFSFLVGGALNFLLRAVML